MKTDFGQEFAKIYFNKLFARVGLGSAFSEIHFHPKFVKTDFYYNSQKFQNSSNPGHITIQLACDFNQIVNKSLKFGCERITYLK